MEKEITPSFNVTLTLTEVHLKDAVKVYLAAEGYDASMARLQFHHTRGDRPGEMDTHTVSVIGVRPAR